MFETLRAFRYRWRAGQSENSGRSIIHVSLGFGKTIRMPNSHVEPTLPLPGSNPLTQSRVSQCIVSFGSNLGDRHDLLAKAAARLAVSDLIAEGSQFVTSRLFETPPIGGPGGQEPFLNAVGVFETTAPARRVLDDLQHLEHELGRQRRKRWDARSIDLDVVLHGNLVGGATGLVVPHPRYTARQFVLKPACDVAAHFRDPRFGWTLGQLSAHLDADVPSLAFAAGRQHVRDELCNRLADEYGVRLRQFDSGERENVDAETPEPWIAARPPRLPKLKAKAFPVPPSDRPHEPGNDDQPISLDQNSIDQHSIDQHSDGWPGMPRLLVRIQRSAGGTHWPAPHLMWPGGWSWPEYRLEIDDTDWAVSELASALESMRCSAHAVTENGHWWQAGKD